MASYYSNYDLNVALSNVHALKREVEKKLEFAKKVLQSIAGTRTGTDLSDKSDLPDNAGTNPQTEIGLLGENAETDAAGRVIEPARMTREEMIAAAKTALAELNTRKEW